MRETCWWRLKNGMTDSIDLAPAHLEIVEGILAEHVPECEVRAFGSRATWTARDASDLDLALVGDGPLDWRALARLREDFEESRLPIRVDVLDWHDISESFQEVIARDYVVLREGAQRDGWRTVTLGDHVTLTKGLSYKSDYLNQQGPSLVGLGQFSPDGGMRTDNLRTYAGEYRPKDIANSGDLLIAMTDLTQEGAVLGCPLVVPPVLGESCLYTLDVAKLDLDEEIVPQFLYYMLRDQNFRAFVRGCATGTTVRRVRPTDVLAYEFPLPPLHEQRAIARVLGTLDDKIELNRRMNATLEAMARALFRSWFVDFEPVRAKEEGRWRAGQSLPGLPAHLHPHVPARLVPTPHGPTPAGWPTRALGDVVDVNPRRSIKRGEMATHVEMAALPTSGPHVAEWTQRAFTSGSRFTRGDTLLARITPSLENGKTALVDFLEDGETGWGSTEFIVLRPKPPWPPEFAYLQAREPSFREHAIVNMTGTSGRQRVPAEAVANYEIVTPPDEVAVAFGALVRPLFESASSASRQSRALAAQRDTLLPRLMSGELRAGAMEQRA